MHVFSGWFGRQATVTAYLVAIGSVILAFAVRQLLDPVVGDRLPFGTFFIAVMAVSWWTGVKPTFVALLLSSAIAIFLYIPPRNELAFSGLPDVLGWIIFFFVGLSSAIISEAHRAAHQQAELSTKSAQTVVQQLEAEVHQHQITLAAFKNKDMELKDFIENAITPMHQVDDVGRIVWANQAELDLTGYSREEYIGHPITDFYVDQQVISVILQRLSRNEAVRGYEAQLLARDNSVKHVLINASPYQVMGQDKYSHWFNHDITERKDAETTQSRLSAIVKFSDDAIVSKSLEGVVMSWNSGATRIFGYTQDEMIGQSIRILFPSDRLPEEDEFLQRIAQGEHIRRYETVRIHKDGRKIDISVTLSPIQDVTGKVIGVSKIAHDITDRKREEQRSQLLLELSTALSRAITREQIAGVIVQEGFKSLNARVGVVGLLDDQGMTLELINSNGLSQSSAWQYARTSIDFNGPLNEAVRTDRMVWIESFEEYITCYPHLKEAVLRNGSQSIIALPLKVNEKILGGFSLSFPFEKPRTPGEETFFKTLAYLCAQALERTSLYAMLEAEHQRLANILATVPGIIWENEHRNEQEEMKLVFISGYVETMLGYTVQEALAEPRFWFKIFHPEDAEKTAEAFYKVRRSHGSGVVNFRAIHKDGSLIYIQALMTTILRNGEPVGKRGVMMDVSERQKLLDMQTHHMTMLRNSNEELQRFAYVAAHDLQEPLRMVASYLQLIENRYTSQLDETAHEFIAYAVDGAVRMKEMLTALLAYARVDQDDKPFERFETENALKTALTNLTLQIAESNAQITHDPMPVIRGDEIQITRVFQNLINNSLKFQRQGNTPQIHIGVERQKNVWQFCVRDNGIGIAPEALDHIFVILKRLHRRSEYPGTGMGLAICKKIIERHGGRIWVRSKPEQETTFYFTLPA